MNQEVQTGELKIDRIPQSKESIGSYKYHIITGSMLYFTIELSFRT